MVVLYFPISRQVHTCTSAQAHMCKHDKRNYNHKHNHKNVCDTYVVMCRCCFHARGRQAAVCSCFYSVDGHNAISIGTSTETGSSLMEVCMYVSVHVCMSIF